MPAHDRKKRLRPVIEEISSPPIEEDTPILDSSVEMQVEVDPSVSETPSVDQTPNFPTINSDSGYEKKTNFKFLFLLTIVVSLVVGFVAGGFYVYFSGISSLKTGAGDEESTVMESSLPTSTPSASPTPSPTPGKSAEVSDLKVNILNGSGKSGEAGRAKALVEKAGFEVGSTGNAARFDYTDTIVQTKKSVGEETVKMLTEALEASYSVKAGTALSNSSSFDIVITVGSK